MVSRVRLFDANVGDDKAVGCERLALTDYVDARQVVLELAARWAHRAISVHAAHALRSAGLTEHADRLAAIPAWRWDDRERASAAADAAYAAARAADAAYASRGAAYASRGAAYASRAADAADAAYASRGAAYAAAYAAAAYADAAAYAYTYAYAAEENQQNTELEHAMNELLANGGSAAKGA
jgi:hypothetical protein